MIKLALSVGEPAGIGPDLAIKLAQYNIPAAIVAIADKNLLQERARKLNLPLEIIDFKKNAAISLVKPSKLYVQHIPLATPSVCGTLNSQNASYVLNSITTAVKLCQEKQVDAMVTGPVHKGIINEAKIPFNGHTEFIAKLTNTADIVMMLATDQLRVALVTTHLPLAQVPHAITKERLEKTIIILNNSLKNHFHITNPKIGICGLNPHAGEGGHVGQEEITTIIPVIDKLNAKGLNLIGPIAADSIFIQQNRCKFDAILAMYHDQGLAALKALGFSQAVNLTLGLPIIRTSVDHGTALELAGTSSSCETSLLKAIELAAKMAP